jgi:hypothetical protein
MQLTSRLLLQGLLVANGAIAAGTGTAVVAGGPGAIPGGGRVPASVDSVLRFYAVYWAASGVALWRLVPRVEQETAAIQRACATMFIGGTARLLAARCSGRPHTLFQALTVVELVTTPAIVAWQRSIAAVPTP